MSWFSFTDLAKNALSEAQKKIDQALDIQAKEEVEDSRVKQNDTSTLSFNENDQRLSNSEIPVPKAEFGIKEKSMPMGSTQRTKKITGDINDDFFSVLLNDEPSTTTPCNSRDFAGKTVVLPTTKEISNKTRESAVQENALQPQSDTLSNTERDIENTQPSKSTFTEVPLMVADDPDEILTKPSETTTKGAMNVSLRLTPDLPKNTLPTQDSPISLGESFKQSDNSTSERVTSVGAAFSMSQESSSERTVSPSISTATSSEIDILDHESTVIEISSRCNEGQFFIQSQLPLRNVDTVDSDASQAMSPVPQDTDRSSPPFTMIEPTLVSHSFQSLEHVNSLTSQQSAEGSEAANAEEPQLRIQSTEEGPDKCGDKLLELSEKTEVYEQQLITLCQKNAQLDEENDNLRSEIVQLKEDREKELRKDMEKVSDSFKSLESASKVLVEEKANLLKQITGLKSHLASRMTNEQVQNAIAEKEESIKGLMDEGEVLAKKHLQQNNLIKKLKSQSQEKESELKSLREKVTKYEAENSRLKDELKLTQGQGQEERETSLRISDAYEQRERETQILQEKLLQAEEKQRTLQVNLDAAYKEIGDLHKQTAEQESRASAEWKEKEVEILRENDIEKKKILSEQEHVRQLLMLQIMELNNAVSRAEASAARKDDDHRREVKHLQQRFQDSEGRNQDLSDNVSSATRPLLRQIENLQATHASQQRSWNALEKTLNSRIGEAQAELLTARESERIAHSTAIDAKSKAAAFEKHIDSSEKTISLQGNEVELLGKQIVKYKLQTKNLTEELEELKTMHKETVHKSRKERLFLENQLQMEKVRSEAERKKYSAQQEAFQREKDRLMWGRSEITSVSSNQVIETESVGSSSDAFHSTDGLEKQPSYLSLMGLSNQLSVSNVLENLQTQLKLRDGEIAQLRGEINMLERTRSSMAEEIVRLTNLNEDLDGVSKEIQDMKGKLDEVENRYAAILTMYGEKEEENEELKMDLADVKAMYRQQINDLLTGETVS